jgi:isoquinoline 1-oxidoreductase subunit alpha
MPFKLTVNGKAVTVDVPADMPLLWVIREVLNMPGTKFGCGMSLCGACKVHVNGVATPSCITSIAEANGKNVTTIEGLASSTLHPLQKAWMEVDVAQCGYCQAGQIMSAAALLKEHPNPTDAQIDAAMDGNICRCGTYLRIREAIHKAAGNRRSS